MSGWRGPAAAMLVTAAVTAAAAIWATPHVIMRIAHDRMVERTGVNQFFHAPLTSFENQTIVRPSPDLAYSACPFDLSKGPLQIDFVPVPGRYSSLSLFDARTDVIFVRNDTQAKSQPFSVTLALPDQRVAKGVEVVRTQYPRGIALIRVLLREPGELANVDAVRRQSTCRIIGGAKRTN